MSKLSARPVKMYVVNHIKSQVMLEREREKVEFTIVISIGVLDRPKKYIWNIEWLGALYLPPDDFTLFSALFLCKKT